MARIIGELKRHGPTEAEFQKMVVDLARLLGYRACHFRPARTAHGWATPMMGDTGFPDTVIVGYGWLIVAELKVGNRKPTLDQSNWLNVFAEVAGCLTFLWYPSDWPEIESTLKGLAK